MKKSITLVTLIGLLVVSSASAQSDSFYSAFQAMDSGQLTLLILLGVVLGVIVLMLILMIYLMSFIKWTLGKDSPAAVGESTWRNDFVTRFITGKRVEPGSDQQLAMADHSYDGITELDNFMPPWLQYVFLFTVLFGIGYFVNYSVLGIGLTGVEEYAEELRIEEIALKERKANQLAGINEENVVFDGSAGSISAGKVIFEGNCAACHAKDGGGGVGPNFTDDYWIHGGDITDIFRVVKYGVLDKGMVPWEAQLTPLEIQQVSSYILTFLGTIPANPKAPQGELHVAQSPVLLLPEPDSLEVARVDK